MIFWFCHVVIQQGLFVMHSEKASHSDWFVSTYALPSVIEGIFIHSEWFV